MRPMALEYTTEPPYRPVSYQLIRGLGRGERLGRSRGERGGAGGGGGGGPGLARLQCRPGWDPTLGVAVTQLRTNKDFWVRTVLVVKMGRRKMVM